MPPRDRPTDAPRGGHGPRPADGRAGERGGEGGPVDERSARARDGRPGDERNGGGGEGPSADDRGARGREAEDLAAAFLEARGCEVIARNHRIRRGEVDLVCRDGDVLCFVEVRSRTGGERGEPEETVGPGKARRVVAAATDWALRNGGVDRAVRFDVVAVTFGEGAPRVVHFPAAFDASGRPGVW